MDPSFKQSYTRFMEGNELPGTRCLEYSLNSLEKFFRRHCVLAKYMEETWYIDFVLFIDSDIGVVNPKRLIEDFIDPQADIIFYYRFFNWEVMAGSYLVRNTDWTRKFLTDFADYESHIPKSYHGSDNGAIHEYLAGVILPTSGIDLAICHWIYNNAQSIEDLFVYEACIRDLMGNSTTFGRIKILPKGTAWARDAWVTNSKWNEETDFMLHHWKKEHLRSYKTTPIPVVPELKTPAHGIVIWYNPLAGPVMQSLCTKGNTTWHYDNNLIATPREIKERMLNCSKAVEEERAVAMSKVRMLRKSWLTMEIWNVSSLEPYLESFGGSALFF